MYTVQFPRQILPDQMSKVKVVIENTPISEDWQHDVCVYSNTKKKVKTDSNSFTDVQVCKIRGKLHDPMCRICGVPLSRQLQWYYRSFFNKQKAEKIANFEYENYADDGYTLDIDENSVTLYDDEMRYEGSRLVMEEIQIDEDA